MPQLRALTVGDNPAGWQKAGFTVVDNSTIIGSVTINFDEQSEPGIANWTLSNIPDDADAVLDNLGLPTHRATGSDSLTGLIPGDVGRDPTAAVHANAVQRIDHLVIQAADMAATTIGMAKAGFDARRQRPIPHSEEPARQVFYWAGDVIVELVGPVPVIRDQQVDSTSAGDGPTWPDARFWGLALASSDLDQTLSTLGSSTSDPRPAVQPGRRITIVDHRAFGIGVPLAVLSPHPSDTVDA